MRKIALSITIVVATVIATPMLAQDFRANRVGCMKEVGGSQMVRHGRYGWSLHHQTQMQPYMDCLARRAAFTSRVAR